jgi:hypothetical protein
MNQTVTVVVKKKSGLGSTVSIYPLEVKVYYYYNMSDLSRQRLSQILYESVLGSTAMAA